MAEINVEKKGAIWPWILAAVIVLVLIWLLIKAFDVNVDSAGTADRPLATTPATTTPSTDAPAVADPSIAATDNMQRFAGTYAGANVRVDLDTDGTYSMQEGAAAEVDGSWTHDAAANALLLIPGDGTRERRFQVEGDGTLMPLKAAGEPAGQVALTRQ